MTLEDQLVIAMAAFRAAAAKDDIAWEELSEAAREGALDHDPKKHAIMSSRWIDASEGHVEALAAVVQIRKVIVDRFKSEDLLTHPTDSSLM